MRCVETQAFHGRNYKERSSLMNFHRTKTPPSIAKHVKTTIKATLIGIICGLSAFFFALLLSSRDAHAASVYGAERYKVIDLARLETAERVEQALNQLGDQGWKVRASTMS